MRNKFFCNPSVRVQATRPHFVAISVAILACVLAIPVAARGGRCPAMDARSGECTAAASR